MTDESNKTSDEKSKMGHDAEKREELFIAYREAQKILHEKSRIISQLNREETNAKDSATFCEVLKKKANVQQDLHAAQQKTHELSVKLRAFLRLLDLLEQKI